MRGRTLNDAFIILDEAQNTTSEQMKMFLTRLGFNAKMVITGDITQVDLPSQPPVRPGRGRSRVLRGIDGHPVRLLQTTATWSATTWCRPSCAPTTAPTRGLTAFPTGPATARRRMQDPRLVRRRGQCGGPRVVRRRGVRGPFLGPRKVIMPVAFRAASPGPRSLPRLRARGPRGAGRVRRAKAEVHVTHRRRPRPSAASMPATWAPASATDVLAFNLEGPGPTPLARRGDCLRGHGGAAGAAVRRAGRARARSSRGARHPPSGRLG